MSDGDLSPSARRGPDSDFIVEGARTVVSIAAHFERLKLAATSLLEAGSASARGYFTPSEDEELRHLLVSYWQSRNALIELVITLYDRSSFYDESEPDVIDSLSNDPAPAFVVAWAGALVLIDAAIFLRRNCQDRSIVLQKLNEPEPHFGIPAGTYDRVQASLTSPVHAWHLYHAREYWNQNQRRLVDLTRGTELHRLIGIIEQNQVLNDVDLQRYTVARFRVRARQAKTTSRNLIGRAFYGLQKAVSRLIADRYTHRGHSPQLPDEIAEHVCRMIQPGDVFINRKEHALTNYFLPGYWPHAALYLGRTDQLEQMGMATHENGLPRWQRLLECDRRNPGRVVEAMKDGVWIRSLNSPFVADAVTVIRPRLPSQVVAEAIGRALFHDGKPYDFDFDFTRSDRLVCTEVVYRSYEGLAGVRFQLTRRAGRLTLAAEDLIRMALRHQHFDLVAVYCPSHQPAMATGADAAELVRATLED